MKEIIEEYYNIEIDNLTSKNDTYTFYYRNNNYVFTFFNRTIEELDDLLFCLELLKKYNIKTLEFIPNKNGKVLTTIEENNYILLKAFDNFKRVVDLEEIIDNNKKLIVNHNYQRLYRNNWASLWSAKLDYYEYQMKELGKDKSVISNSFDYYYGLAMNAIALVSNCQALYDQNIDKLVLSHRRIFYPNYSLNYYNPISFVFDLKIRDIAEYIKSLFFNKEDAFLDLSTYLKSVKLSPYSYQMFFARLLYPSYYFDLYDKVMNQKLDEELLIPVIKESCNYELFLKKAYLEISKYANIDKVEWIINLKEH